jgi:hypothetical protein
MQLAKVLKALDQLSCERVLSTTTDAFTRELQDDRGLGAWCYDKRVDRDAGRLIASRLDKRPYLDGVDGLFAQVERADRVIEARVGDEAVYGAGLAALRPDAVLVALQCDDWPPSNPLQVVISNLYEEVGESSSTIELSESFEVAPLISEQDVCDRREALSALDVPRDGVARCDQLATLYPRLRFSDDVLVQLRELTGSEGFWGQVWRHLQALNHTAMYWLSGPFEPAGVSYSVESKATLEHGSLGPLRDFATPDGFEHQRWTLHTKITGGEAIRLYYRPCDREGQMLVLIGYVGSHLPTVNHKT